MDVWMALSPAWWMVLCTKTSPFLQAYFEQRVFGWRLTGAICKTNAHAHTHTQHKQMYGKVVRAGKLQSWIFLQCRSKHHSTFLGYTTDFSWKNLQIFTTWAAWTFQCMQALAFLLLALYEDFGSFGIVQACSCNHFTSRPRIVGDAIRHFAQGRGCFEKTQVQVTQGAIALPGKGQLLCKLHSKLP